MSSGNYLFPELGGMELDQVVVLLTYPGATSHRELREGRWKHWIEDNAKNVISGVFRTEYEAWADAATDVIGDAYRFVNYGSGSWRWECAHGEGPWFDTLDYATDSAERDYLQRNGYPSASILHAEVPAEVGAIAL